MEIKTHKEMLVKYIGEVGTPERDAFDAQVRAGVEEYRIGEAIKQTRKKIGFTQQQLGERVRIQAAMLNGDRIYRLMVGSFSSRRDAERYRDKIGSRFSGCFVVNLQP